MPKQSLSLDGVQDFSDNKGKPINPGFYCYLILRSEVQTPDKYGIFCNQHGHWEHHFSGKKRLVEVRVQGKFLKKPRGPLFFGGEITSPMSLGFVLGPLARLMLKIVAGISTGLFHASFATSEPDERPHICTSFFGGMDQVIVTKNGDPLPNLMEQVKEDPEARKARRRSTDAFDCDLNASSKVYERRGKKFALGS